MVGVVAGALAMAPVLQILFKAYGIGNVLPRAGMDPMQALAAPKAALMAAIASSVFTKSLDWSMFGLGALLAFVIILIDEICKRRKSAWRLPILGVAIGVYMPLEISVAVFIGGAIAHVVNRKQKAQGDSTMQNRGLLFCSGMIAGEALVGIALAVPFAAYQATDCFSIAPQGFGPISVVLGVVTFCAIILYLYKISTNKAK